VTLVQELIEAREKEGYPIWIAGGASNDEVIRLEKALGLLLPPSYVAFLTAYGAIGVGDSFVSGIVESDALHEGGSSAYGDTLALRARQGFPSNLIVIGKHEDGAYCLDTARHNADREYPVVNFEFGSIQHHQPVAISFQDWLIRFQLYGTVSGGET